MNELYIVSYNPDKKEEYLTAIIDEYCKYEITFNDNEKWYLDEDGIVLYASFQDGVWQGGKVDFSQLQTGELIGLIDKETEQTTFYNLVVNKITTRG